ncbi:hypothetical protein CBOM_03688 [Ceraceosorus bombacis]|uniref:Uncharacterized protein n=1 Tax=Ceraceosorus bombacis TaxID=401625 RepID=A0A0P1BIB5_9BASI|nr:hypothetical protein CBOM_03688 [Ceraceosorus bombacis]
MAANPNSDGLPPLTLRLPVCGCALMTGRGDADVMRGSRSSVLARLCNLRGKLLEMGWDGPEVSNGCEWGA